MKVRYLSIIVIAILASACGGAISVKTDYDTTANFAKYQTIAIKPGHSSGDPVMDQRVLEDVAQALQAKGYRIAPEDQADAIAVVHAATREQRTYDVFYDGWPGWDWRWGWGSAVVHEYDFTVGTLVVDIFDARTKRAVWHGSATDVVTGDPERDAKKIRKAITQLLERFPPQTQRT